MDELVVVVVDEVVVVPVVVCGGRGEGDSTCSPARLCQGLCAL